MGSLPDPGRRGRNRGGDNGFVIQFRVRFLCFEAEPKNTARVIYPAPWNRVVQKGRQIFEIARGSVPTSIIPLATLCRSCSRAIVQVAVRMEKKSSNAPIRMREIAATDSTLETPLGDGSTPHGTGEVNAWRRQARRTEAKTSFRHLTRFPWP
jgi:hypothetical protein